MRQSFGRGGMQGAQRGMAFGVCAMIGDRAAVPAWVPRLVFVLLALQHLWLAVLFYAVLFALGCTRKGSPPARQGDWSRPMERGSPWTR